MTDVFISYASQDRERIAPLVRVLEEQGWSVFWDRETPVGQSWPDYIEAILDDAKCIVVAWSEASKQSEWVREEANEGKQRKVLAPLLLEDVRLPFGFRNIQTADLKGWPDNHADSELTKLMAAISQVASILDDTNATSNIIEVPTDRPIQIPGMTFIKAPDNHAEIKQDFLIGTYPVTFKDYGVFTKIIGKEQPKDRDWGRGKRPVIYANWHDAVAYTEWLTKEKKQPYRLPSETEWEYAALAGGDGEYGLGEGNIEITEDNLGDHAWYSANSDGKTHEVGQKKPNVWGLYDMLGNVWEWTTDFYDKEKNRYTVRGGAWGVNPQFLRVRARFRGYPGDRDSGLGFRVVCVPQNHTEH